MVVAVVLIISLIGLYWLVTYNRLVRLKTYTQEAWSQIDVQLKRRNDLIPNLVKTVQAYTDHENTVLTEITTLRKKLQADAKAPTNLAVLQMTGLIEQLLMQVENYPDLKANTTFMKLSKELTYTEDKIAYARRLYNRTVARYNTMLQSFPSNLVAQLHHFKQRQLLVTPESERQVPDIDLGGQ
jgi:LemA protein